MLGSLIANAGGGHFSRGSFEADCGGGVVSGWSYGVSGGGELVQFGGEGDVVVGDAAGVVGYQGEADAVVADVDIGVVVGFFGEGGGVVDEIDGSHEGGKGEGAGDLAVFEGPAGESGEGGLEGFWGEGGAHGILPLCLEYRCLWRVEVCYGPASALKWMRRQRRT